MKRKESSAAKDSHPDSDLPEDRCRRRLREVLGVNAPGIAMILRLRSQVLALQTRVRELETQLTYLETSQKSRFTRSHETFPEISWRDLFSKEEEG